MKRLILTEEQYVDFLNEKQLRVLRANCRSCKQKSKIKNLFESVQVDENLKVGQGTVCLNPKDVTEFINSIRKNAIKLDDKYQRFIDSNEFSKLKGIKFTRAQPFIHSKSKLFKDEGERVEKENRIISQLKKELDEVYKKYRASKNNNNAEVYEKIIKEKIEHLSRVHEGLAVDIDNFKKNLMVLPNSIIGKNAKMMKSGAPNEFVVNTGIPAVGAIIYNRAKDSFEMVETCPGRGSCATFCYAMSHNYTRFFGTYDIMIRRLNFMINDPQGYEEMFFKDLYSLAKNKGAIITEKKINEAINQFISINKQKVNNIKSKNPNVTDSDVIGMLKDEYDKYLLEFMNKGNKIVLRWNDSGDWFSEDYVTIGSNVVRRLRQMGVNVTTTTYTKIAQVSADIRGVWDAKKDLAIYSVGGASKREIKKFQELEKGDTSNRPIKKAISPDGTNFKNPVTDKSYNELFEDFNYMVNIDKGGENNNEILRRVAEDYMGIENVDLKDSSVVSSIKSKIREIIPFIKNDLREQMQYYLNKTHNEPAKISDIIYYDEMRKSFEIRTEEEMRYYVIVPKGSGDDAAMYPSTKMVINLMH
jgi:hypothetical protein